MNWELFFKELFIIVATTIVPFLAHSLYGYLYSATQDIENEKARFYIDKSISAIRDIVVEINQTYVSSLKAKGEFTPEAQQVAKQTAIAKANQMICAEAKEAIAAMYGDFNAFLQTKIEAVVNEEKKV